MVGVRPDQARFARAARLDRLLTLVLALVVLVLAVFLVRHGLQAWINVERSGVPLNSLPEVLKACFEAFFASFGDLSGRYLLLVSLMLLINAVGITANVLLKFAEKRIFYYILLIVSIGIVFNLPIDRLYQDYVRQGRTLLYLFFTMMVLCFPYMIGRFLSENASGWRIARKLLYIVILGLLVVQMIIE